MISDFQLKSPILRKLHSIYWQYAPDAVRDPYVSNHWKEKVLYFIVLLGSTVGFAILILSTPSNLNRNYWLIQTVVYTAYAICLFLFFFPRAPYRLRAAIISSLFYVIGLSIILNIGPFLASREWLFSFSIVASILLGWHGAIASIIINVMTWVLVGVLIKAEYWSNLLHLESPLVMWHQTAMDLLFVNISTTVLITLFFIRINHSDQAAKNYSQLLFKEGNKLAETNKRLEAEIEDRKAVAQALRESEEKYRTILESIHDAYFEIDLKGNLTFFNRAMTELMACPEKELTGLNYRVYTDKSNSEKFYRIFHSVYASGRSSPPVDIELISMDNTLIAASVLISLKRDKNGKTIGFQGLARDITEKRAMESRLQQAQKMEAIGTLAGGVAHDLNNILSGVVNYPEFILMDMSDDDPLRMPLETVKSSGEKAVAIVQDLLTLARRGVGVKEPVNLNSVIREYLESIEYKNLQSFYPQIEMKTLLEEKLFNMSGSPVHLSKVIMNLVSNAVEAIPETRNGKVRISTRNRVINEGSEDSLHELKAGKYIILTVQDTGDGIAPDDLDKIFEPFYTKKVMGRSGTGLGMAVVWGTVQDHGGAINVRSIVGKGTTITIHFPGSKRVTIKKRIKKKSANMLQGNGESILVVDDVATQREIATVILNRLGYRVQTVSSGEKAIEFLEERCVDLVVLDMIMRPGIDGLETYRRIVTAHPGQKAIIASGFSETEQVKQAQQLGAGRYIRKPYSIEGLGSAIRRELDG